MPQQAQRAQTAPISQQQPPQQQYQQPQQQQQQYQPPPAQPQYQQQYQQTPQQQSQQPPAQLQQSMGALAIEEKHEEKGMMPEQALAQRKAPGTAGSFVIVHTNSFQVPFKGLNFVHRYVVEFEPQINQDQQSLRRKRLGSFKRQLDDWFDFWVFDGINIISLKNKDNCTFSAIQGSAEVSITVVKNRDIDTTDVSKVEVQMVLNVLLKKLLRSLDLLNFQRSYYNPIPKDIPNSNIKVYSGFVFTVNPTLRGLQACVELAHKVVQKKTVRDVMNEIEKNVRRDMGRSNEQKVRDEIIKQTNEAMHGSVVSLAYDKRAYRIDRVDFTKTLGHAFSLQDGSTTTYRQYYQDQWGGKVQVPSNNKPGLLTHCRIRKLVKGLKWHEVPVDNENGSNNIYLVPEFCHLTGVTEAMRGDYRLMTALAKEMRKPPDARMRIIKGHVNNILNSPGSQEIFRQLPLTILPDETQVRARSLPMFSVQFANRKSKLLDAHRPSWMSEVRNGFFSQGERITDWVMLHQAKDKPLASKIAQNMQGLAARGNNRMSEPRYISVEKGRGRDLTNWEIALRKIIQRPPSVLVALVPFGDAGVYSCIKSFTLQAGLVSQCFSTSTLKNPKMLNPVCGNGYKQLCHKMNWVSWNIDMSEGMPSLKGKLDNAMIIGVDVSHDKKQAGAYGKTIPGSTIGFCASYDRNFTKFFSLKAHQGSNEEYVKCSASLLEQALNHYSRVNKRYPKSVIVFRDGVGDSQLDVFVNREISEYSKAFAACRISTSCKLSVVVVQKRTNHRIFGRGRDGSFDSAPVGVCVDTEICSPSFSDFFLVTCKAPPGASARPTRYIIAKDENNFSSDEIQCLTHRLCYMYENWTGPIRVPSPVMYAHKIAYLYGKLVNGEPNKSLLGKLHFL